MQTRPTATATIATAIIAASAAIAPSTNAQDALGDGTALDANQRVGSGGRNAPARDFAREVRLRNAIVSGDAVGGANFRGDVGYGSEFGFRGAAALDEGTGSELVTNFLRDSAISGLATRGIRGISDLQAQLNLTADFGATGRSPFVIDDVGAAFSARQLNNPSTPGTDIFASLDGTLRSTSAVLARRAELPQTLGLRQSPQGVSNALIASALSGIREISLENSQFRGAETYDATLNLETLGFANADQFVLGTLTSQNEVNTANDAAIRDAFDPFSEQAFARSARTDEGEDQQLRPTQLSNRIDAQTDEAREETRVVSTPLGRDRLLSQMFSLSRSDTAAADGTDEPTPQDLAQTEALFRALSETLRDPALPTQPAPNTDIAPTDAEEPDNDDIADDAERAVSIIRRSRTRVDSLTNLQGQSKAAFDNHITNGQRWIAEGRWFDAEERFTAALTINPDSLEAEVGRINAQIGAGLYTSAALNLRFLFRDYPELVNVIYADTLIPRGDRLTDILTELQERALRPGTQGRDAAFILAYLAFQTDRGNLLDDAFTRLQQIEQENNSTPDPLTTLLQRVWGE